MNRLTDKAPSITVLMCIYKEPMEWLQEAIDSILNQSFNDFEYIIIIDNPQNKDAISYVKKVQDNDSRVVFFVNETNIGLPMSLNKGLRIAKGKYIARMDADDRSYPERFSKQFSFMEAHPNVVLCGTSIRYFGGKKVWNHIYPSKDQEIKAEMLFNAGFSHPSVFIRKRVLDENNISYDVTYKHSEDYKMWETLYDLGDFANLSDVLLDYRFSNVQISNIHKTSMYEGAMKIRRHLINQWLNKIGHNDLDFSQPIDRLKIRKSVLYILHDVEDVFFVHL